MGGGGGGGTYDNPTPLTFFCFELLIDFLRACRQFAIQSRKIIENLQFAVHIETFPKNTLFALPPPGRAFGSMRDLLRKK